MKSKLTFNFRRMHSLNYDEQDVTNKSRSAISGPQVIKIDDSKLVDGTDTLFER